MYFLDSGQIVQELVPPEDEDDLICLIEAVVDDPGNGVIVVVENLERPGLIKVLTYSDPGVHAESYSSKEIQLSEVRISDVALFCNLENPFYFMLNIYPGR